jgi:hypothetical protein
MHITLLDWLRDDELTSCGVTKSSSKKIAETLLLPSLEIPEGSYALVFDGGPMPERSTEVSIACNETQLARPRLTQVMYVVICHKARDWIDDFEPITSKILYQRLCEVCEKIVL